QTPGLPVNVSRFHGARECTTNVVNTHSVYNLTTRWLSDHDFGQPGVPRAVRRPDHDHAFSCRQILQVNAKAFPERVDHSIGGLDWRPRSGVDRVLAAPERRGRVTRLHVQI